MPSAFQRVALACSLLVACGEDAEPSNEPDATATPVPEAGLTLPHDAGELLDASETRDAGEAPFDATVMDAAVDAFVVDASMDAGLDARTPMCAGALDVVWIQDSSGSLLFAEQAVQRNLEALARRAADGDLNLIVLSAQPPLVSDAGTRPYAHVLSEVDSKALFHVALTQFPTYAAFLRQGAATHLVGVTDDQDLLPPAQFKAEMEALLGHAFTFHAVASPSENDMPCISDDQKWNSLCVSPIPSICAAAAVGTSYYEAAALTGGEQVSICRSEWTPLLDRLGCP